jgi:hypothetical protein
MKKILLILTAIVLFSCGDSIEKNLENALFYQFSRDFNVSKENPMGAVHLEIKRQSGNGRYYCTYDVLRTDSFGYFYSVPGTAVIQKKSNGEYVVIEYNF